MRNKTLTGWRRNALTAVVILICLCLYALSLATPAFEIVVEGRATKHKGFEAFEIGLIAPFNEFLGGLTPFVAWLANPCFLVGVALLATRRELLAGLFGLLGIIAASTMLFQPHLLHGYYLWLASMAMVTVSAVILHAIFGCVILLSHGKASI
jgi:hypothetical protein